MAGQAGRERDRGQKREVRRVKSDMGLHECWNLYCERGEHEGEALSRLAGLRGDPVHDGTGCKPQ